MARKLKTYPEFARTLEDEAPALMKDFNQWMIDTNDRPDWQKWDSKVLIGWLLMYMSEMYIIFPDILYTGEYTKEVPLNAQQLSDNITEYERFLYNTLAEIVRMNKELFK